MGRVALLTRPLPVRDGVAEALQAAGMESLSLPTLAVTGHIDAAFEAHLIKQNYDGVVCVSQHAVTFAQQRLTALNFNFSPHTWLAAVGAASAQGLRQAWPDARIITPAVQDSQDSEGLWRALEQTGSIAPSHKVLIVRAQTGRDVLLQRMQTAHMQVDVWSCYQRQPLIWSDTQKNSVQTALMQHGLAISLTSIEGLHGLLHNLAPIVPQLWQQPVITLHPAIAQAAQQAGFSNISCVPASQIANALLAQRDRLLVQ